MKKPSEVCVIIQARLSSERCKRKMIRDFGGTSLVDIAIKKILDSKAIPKENLYLSANEPELVEIGEKNGVNIFKRSEHSAVWDGGTGAKLTGMYEWWDKLSYKYIILVNACNPFLETSTIDSFYEHYLQSTKTGLFAVIEKKNYFWNEAGQMLNEWPAGEPNLNTKAVETTYEAAHCLYASEMNTIGDGVFMGDFSKQGDIELFPISERESLDIDHEWQFKYLDFIYRAVKL
jgi:CMP-N-acetylneuraminic acid synthetase